MSCPCPSSSPPPVCTPLGNPIPGMVRAFFGSQTSTGKCMNDGTYKLNGADYSGMNIIQPVGKPGNCTSGFVDNFTTKIFTGSGEDFVIPDYSCRELVEGGVLPLWNYTSFGNGPYGDGAGFIPQLVLTVGADQDVVTLFPFDLFYLSEQELLSTSTYEGWLMWGSINSHCAQFESFSSKVCWALGFDIHMILYNTLKSFESLAENSDVSGLSLEFNAIKKYFKQSDKYNSDAWQTFFLEREAKLELCYQWIKSIHDEYYGRQYLVRVGNFQPNPPIPFVPFRGICVKDQHGNSVEHKKPMIIDGDGIGQDVLLSDQVASEGGFPKKGSTNILGLIHGKDTQNFQTEDGRISCFVRFGEVRSMERGQWEDTKIHKFDGDYRVNFTKMSADNYYIRSVKLGRGYYQEILYIKATVADKIFIDDEGQHVNVILNEKVPLELFDDQGELYKGIELFKILNNTLAESVLTHFKEKNRKNEAKTASNDPKLPDGANSGSSQFNHYDIQDITAFPAGFVIPMKSNLFSYGPYYYNSDPNSAGGGVAFSKDTSLCPWNFNNSVFDEPIIADVCYNSMDCVGKLLVSEGASNIQQLEKGRITVLSLPSKSLGYSVNNPAFNSTRSPTLLTDISVDYGSGGITTTYNFETHTPRFGRTVQFILDSWKENIVKIQKTNNNLKESQRKVDNLRNNLNAMNLANEYTYGYARKTPRGKYSATPTRILMSGYDSSTLGYRNNNTVNPSPPPLASMCPLDSVCGISPSCSPSPPPCCSGSPCPSISPSPSVSPSPSASPCISPSPFPSVSGNMYRMYAFAEQHESSEVEYIQYTYKQLSMMSLDGLFLPVSLLGDGSGADVILNDKGRPKASPDPNSVPSLPSNSINLHRIPRFARPSMSQHYWGETNAKTPDSMPPFQYKSVGQYNLSINQTYLNPMLSVALLNLTSGGSNWPARKANTAGGFVIGSIAYGDSFENYTTTHIDTEERIKQLNKNFRFSALRGPLVVQGWGYDTDGKPIPNYADCPTNTQMGLFAKTNLTDKFMTNWIENPRTWPVGPVDLRFDRNRGVWTCTPPNMIVLARITGTSGPPYTAELIASDGLPHLWGKEGEQISADLSNTQINIYNPIGLPLGGCSKVYAYYRGDSYNYIALNAVAGDSCATDDECWCGMKDCLTSLDNYDENKKQALIHIAASGTQGQACYEPSCLSWENIEVCPSPSPSPSPSVSPSP